MLPCPATGENQKLVDDVEDPSLHPAGGLKGSVVLDIGIANPSTCDILEAGQLVLRNLESVHPVLSFRIIVSVCRVGVPVLHRADMEVCRGLDEPCAHRFRH